MRLKKKNRSSHKFNRCQFNKGDLMYKKLILGIGLIIFGLTTQQAQEFKFAAKVGPNFANDTGDGEFDTGSTAKTGIHLGGVAQMGMNENFAVQAELLYSMQGFKDEVIHKMDYINLPITINYFVIEGLGIQAGPQFGFNIRDTFDDEGSKGSIDAKGFDLAAVFGLQYEFSEGLFIQGRYQLGLTDFIDYNKPSKNVVLSFSLGYFF